MDTTPKKFGAFSSSTNPAEISLTVETTLKVLGNLVGMIATLKGINLIISDDTIRQIADAVAIVVTAGIAIYHAGDFLWGMGRKAIHAVYDK